ANGTLDSSFGSGGQIVKSVAGSDQLSGMVLDPITGSLTVVGTVVGVPSKIAILRYLSSGTLDSSFGLNGQLLTSATLVDDATWAVARQNDGKLVTAGSANTGSQSDFAIARFNGDGTLDTTFGTSGKVTTTFGPSNSSVAALVVQSDGKLVAAGGFS